MTKKYTSINDLSFVKNRSFETIGKVVKYDEACSIGQEGAKELIQFYKDNPDRIGSNALGLIARTFDYSDETEMSGIWVGFFSEIECRLRI